LKHSKQKSNILRNIEKTLNKDYAGKEFESVVQQGLEKKNYENPHLQDRKD